MKNYARLNTKCDRISILQLRSFGIIMSALLIKITSVNSFTFNSTSLCESKANINSTQNYNLKQYPFSQLFHRQISRNKPHLFVSKTVVLINSTLFECIKRLYTSIRSLESLQKQTENSLIMSKRCCRNKQKLQKFLTTIY